jgi:hypothetical protein
MSLLNPWVLLGIVLVVFGAGTSGYFKGSADEYERQQLEIARLNEQARETEKRMGEVAQTYAQNLRKSNDVAKAKETKLRSDIATGKRKLFIPVQAPDCAVPTTADAPAADGDNSGETRAELSGQVSESLISIASEGDTAIRKLNACIESYETLRNMK